jgi:P27 family predicted phage terminase small subunit
MGERGPHPAPTSLRLIRGDRADRVNVDEPVPADAEITCPDWVCDWGQRLWRQLAPDLIAKRVLTPWDAPLFASACDWWGLYRDAVHDVWKQGTLVVGAKGGQVKNPNVEVARGAFESACKIFARFGLTPSDRAQLRLSPKGRSASVDRLLS